MPKGIYKDKTKYVGGIGRKGIKTGKPAWNTGKKIGYIPKMAFKKGQITWNKGLLKEKSHLYGKKYSQKQKDNILLGRKKFYDKNGRISPINHLIRNSNEYKLWRKSVFERDNYICIWCFKKGGWNKQEHKIIILNADHIKPFSLFPELRFAIDNGRTLCVECHKKTNTFGWKSLNNYKKKYDKYR